MVLVQMVVRGDLGTRFLGFISLLKMIDSALNPLLRFDDLGGFGSDGSSG